MPALNFKSEFVGAVMDGSKRCTIRARRKRPIHAPDVLFCFTGMRTKNCRKFKIVICQSVKPVRIAYNRVLRVRVAGRWLRHDEICALARRDGFACLQDFVAFFRSHYGLPFDGDLIEW